MSRVSINDQYLTDIGDGIREKLGVQTLYKPSQMKGAILSIPGASTLVSKTITQNGTYDPADDDADGYSSVVVEVSQGGGGGVYNATGSYQYEDLTWQSSAEVE